MDSQIFEHWVRKLDRKFRVDKRKIATIIDNSPAHPPIFNLTNIQFVFLHPNTTSILQPMDHGVIRSPKAHYRGKVVRLLFRALEKNEPYPKILILQAMKILADSWQTVTKETVINYLKKAGINSDVQKAAVADSDDSFKYLQEHLNELNLAYASVLPEDVTAESIVSLDYVITSAPEIAESDIIEELCLSQLAEAEENENDEEDENSIEERFAQSQEKPTRSKAESALDFLKDPVLCSGKGDEMQSITFNSKSCIALND